ncbi:unnamed protein product [Allacma fusca]|uniref:Uncharacterized protein n=1 Tax=Allacma fusca TaxID=39272 RepID=A0A8J2LLS8_9HEXA|nr:unnamed protein product [Allacma fusca]
MFIRSYKVLVICYIIFVKKVSSNQHFINSFSSLDTNLVSPKILRVLNQTGNQLSIVVLANTPLASSELLDLSSFHSSSILTSIYKTNFTVLTDANVDSVLEKEQTRNIAQSTVSARRFTSSAETIIIPVQNAVFPHNFEHKGYFRNGNKNVFIFVGLEETVKGVLTWRSVQKLRWKFGIVYKEQGKNLVTSKRELIFLNSDLLPSFNADKQSLSGLHFYTTTLRVDAYVAWDNKAPFMGTFFNAVQASSKLSNFTFSINLPSGGLNKLSNGSWTGTIGDVLYNNKDIILGFGQFYRRNHIFDYSTLFGFIELTFYKARAKVGTTDGALLKPYQPFVWFLIGVTFGLLVVVFYFETRHMSVDASFSFWVLYQSHLEQSVSLGNNSSNNLNLLLILTLFYCMIIGTGFKSNLISYLTIPDYEDTPCTFKDLALREDYQPYFVTMNGTGIHYFKTSNASSVVAIRKRMIITTDKVKCLVKVISEPKTVCISWWQDSMGVIARNLTLHRSRSVFEISWEPVFFMTTTMAFSKGFKFYKEFSSIVGSLRDAGFFAKWLQMLYDFETVRGLEYLHKKSGEMIQLLSSASKMEEQLKPFQFGNVAISFSLLVTGLFTSLLLFAYEKMNSLRLQTCCSKKVHTNKH